MSELPQKRLYVIMIADTLETAGKMAGLQLLECEILRHSRGRTVDHDCLLYTSERRYSSAGSVGDYLNSPGNIRGE